MVVELVAGRRMLEARLQLTDVATVPVSGLELGTGGRRHVVAVRQLREAGAYAEGHGPAGGDAVLVDVGHRLQDVIRLAGAERVGPGLRQREVSLDVPTLGRPHDDAGL